MTAKEKQPVKPLKIDTIHQG